MRKSIGVAGLQSSSSAEGISTPFRSLPGPQAYHWRSGISQARSCGAATGPLPWLPHRKPKSLAKRTLKRKARRMWRKRAHGCAGIRRSFFSVPLGRILQIRNCRLVMRNTLNCWHRCRKRGHVPMKRCPVPRLSTSVCGKGKSDDGLQNILVFPKPYN